jgi:branched-chain amino acid transport system substrate-binding protein
MIRSIVKVISFTIVITSGGLAFAQTKEQIVWGAEGVTKDEIVLGMHTDLSGVAATFGVGVVNAFRLRLDEVNGLAGIHGRKIRLVVEDTGYQVPKAVQAANKLLNRDKIFAMVGAAGTQTNNAVLPMQMKAGIPNVLPISWARSMSEPVSPLKFAVYTPYATQIGAAIKYMVEHKGKNVVCAMYQDTDYGNEILDGVKEQLNSMGLKLTEAVSHKPTDQDFSAQIAKLRAAKCDLIAMGTIVRDTIVPYSAARGMGWTDVDFIGTSGTYDLNVSSAQGKATEGFYAVGFFDAPYADTSNQAAAAWIAKYKERYGVDPTITAAIGQVIIDITLRAIDAAGPNLTVEKFASALEKTAGYRDIFGGPVQGFTSERHYSATESNIYTVKDGRWVRVSQDKASN